MKALKPVFVGPLKDNTGKEVIAAGTEHAPYDVVARADQLSWSKAWSARSPEPDERGGRSPSSLRPPPLPSTKRRAPT